MRRAHRSVPLRRKAASRRFVLATRVRPTCRYRRFRRPRRIIARSPRTVPMQTTLAFVFPGQGSQSQGMLATLADARPVVRDAFSEASDGCGIDLWTLAQDGPLEQLNQ